MGVPRELEVEPAAPAPCTYTVDPNARLTIASKVPYAVRVIVLVVGLLMSLVVTASYLWHLPLMVGRSALSVAGFLGKNDLYGLTVGAFLCWGGSLLVKYIALDFFDN